MTAVENTIKKLSDALTATVSFFDSLHRDDVIAIKIVAASVAVIVILWAGL